MNLAFCQTCWTTGSSGAISYQPAGDDFRFGVALLVAKPIEFVDHLGDLLLHLELHFAVAVDVGEHGLVLLVELDLGAVVLDVASRFS